MGPNLSFTAFAWRSPATRINRSVLFICSVLWALWPTQAAFAATVPVSVSITDTPSAVQLGQPFSLNLNFDNTSTTDSGYGPYINLFLPSAGADGDDGYSFVNATYLGAPVTAIALPCPSGNSVSSPVTNLPVVCPTLPVGNNQWVILQLPFGSFAPNQTPAQIQVNIKTSNKADIGVALPIYAQGGFIYGTSATGNEPSSGSIVSTTVAPSLFTLSKSYVGPESETTTGPNYPRAFALQPSMPAGLTATNVLFTDVLPNNIVYQGVTGTGFTVVQQPAIGSGPFNTPPNSNLLVLSMPSSLIGASQPITVNYYVTRTAANGSVVLGVTEFGLNARDAVDAPRLHHQWFPDRVSFEKADAPEFSESLARLRAMGHDVATKGGRQGDAHSIMVIGETLFGAADGRRTLGKAAGY